MKTIKLSITIGILLIVASCNNKHITTKTKEDSKPEAPNQHTSEKALDWAGTYAGTLPCADCMGIEVTIVLNDNQTYEQTLLYLGKKDSSLKEKGKFNWNKEGNTITLISKNSPSFRVNEGHIVMLGDDGKEVTGPLADKYILKKN